MPRRPSRMPRTLVTVSIALLLVACARFADSPSFAVEPIAESFCDR